MSKPLVSDALWAVVEPLLSPEPPKPKGCRPRVPDRAALTGIPFVLQSGTPKEMLPQETGCGSGVTCWRRLQDWQHAGVWDRLQRALLDRLGRRNAIDFSGAALDSASVALLGPLSPAVTRATAGPPSGRPCSFPHCLQRVLPALGSVRKPSSRPEVSDPQKLDLPLVSSLDVSGTS